MKYVKRAGLRAVDRMLDEIKEKISNKPGEPNVDDDG
jgi:hypothetical protein